MSPKIGLVIWQSSTLVTDKKKMLCCDHFSIQQLLKKFYNNFYNHVAAAKIYLQFHLLHSFDKKWFQL